jgi:F-type H+-transporting ATPase subunit b
MQELLSQLGIDWRLLVSQALNFLLLLAVLRIFAYGPIVKILKERKKRIEEGLEKSEEAEKRIREISTLKKERLKEAEIETLAILKRAEGRAKDAEARMLEEAKKKEAERIAETEKLLKAKEQEAREAMRKETTELVRSAIVKTVALSPEKIDQELISRAVKEASGTKQ